MEQPFHLLFSLFKQPSYFFLSFFKRNPLFCDLELMPHFTLDISTTCMKIRFFLLGIGLFFASVTQAQMTGIVIEVDTAFYGPNTPTPDDTFDPDGNLDGFVAYKVFAEFMNTSDVLSAVYADVDALATPPMYIDAPCGCHNP